MAARQVSWRSFLTERMTEQWLAYANYYRLELAGAPVDNPDQRLAEDIKRFISTTVNLTVGLLHDVGTVFTFTAVLWGLSGALHLQLFGHALVIPGYMVWATFIYAAVSTLLTLRIGAPLPRLEFQQLRREADYRFSLVRLHRSAGVRHLALSPALVCRRRGWPPVRAVDRECRARYLR